MAYSPAEKPVESLTPLDWYVIAITLLALVVLWHETRNGDD
jgi:hypothetical protein